ncbi:MAG: ABC transporter ATP-binding protein, partial [Bacteroidia bacterium]
MKVLRSFGPTTQPKMIFSSTRTNINVLSIHNVRISVGQRDILRDVSLHFGPGLHYLIGPNGSGKTSLLRALMGFLPYSGKITINGIEPSSLPSSARALWMAWLPQQPDWPAHLSVTDYVLLGRFPHLSWLGNYTKGDYLRVEKILSDLGLSDFAHREIGTLSGGERQQVALARALSQDTPFLLLDEPAQALDPRNKKRLYERLQLIAASKTVICTTHDLEFLSSPGSLIAALRHGELLWQKPSGIGRETI